jgi:hypothetical protein
MTQFNHMRLYALNGSMYNLDWGYWVVGTTHYDRNECTPGATFGWSEEAEGTMVQRARDRGYFVFQDWASFFNPEPDRWEQNHFWQNDGNASAVYIP